MRLYAVQRSTSGFKVLNPWEKLVRHTRQCRNCGRFVNHNCQSHEEANKVLVFSSIKRAKAKAKRLNEGLSIPGYHYEAIILAHTSRSR